MTLFENGFALAVLSTGVFSLIFAGFAYRKRAEPGGSPLAIFNIAITIALFAYGVDILSTDRTVQLLSFGIWFPLQAVVGVTWLYIALEYAGIKRFATRRTAGVLCLEPILVTVLVIVPSTRPLLVDLPATGTEGSLFFTSATGGPLLVIHYVFLNVTLLAGTVLLLRLIFQSNYLYRLQAVAVAIAAVAPWSALAIQALGLSPALQALGASPQEDPSAIAFAVSGIALTAGLYRFNTLNPVPVAREAVVEEMGDGVVVLTTDGAVSNCNPAARELLAPGTDKDELLGTHIAELLPDWEPPDGVATERSEWQQLSITVEGAERFLEVQVSPLRDRFDRLVGQFVVVRDVTEQTRREQNLARYKTIFESVTDRVFVLDADDRFVVVNDRFAEFLGADAVDLEGTQFATMLTSDQPLPTDAAPTTVERQLETADGEQLPCEIRLAPISFEGVEAGTVGILRDISRRRQIESSLKETTERLETIVEASPLAIIATDVDGSVEVWNQAATEMFGWSSAEVRGSFLPVVSGEAETRLRSLADQVADGERITGEEMTLDCKDGSVIEASFSLAPLSDESGTVQGIVGIVTDITDQKEQQRRLERQNERLDKFASLLSHDLRSPLQVASSRLELLAADVDGDPDHLERSQAALGRMETLIDDALALAREGDDIGETRPFVLADVAERAWEMVETPASNLVVDDRSDPIEGDPTRVVELFENLFRNAIEHGRDSQDEPLEIRVERLEDGFAVEDDGVGIDESVADQLFETGYTTNPKGTGFGLAIVERIANAHGWTARATTGTDGGARFEFRS
ncbi:PAS domain S-box protein [Halovenus halobia]|uniref:PAS domain S-box protein n=1 Tax=Halovenus halobia TaxID=3396622 RepID=UPI003F573DBE